MSVISASCLWEYDCNYEHKQPFPRRTRHLDRLKPVLLALWGYFCSRRRPFRYVYVSPGNLKRRALRLLLFSWPQSNARLSTKFSDVRIYDVISYLIRLRKNNVPSKSDAITFRVRLGCFKRWLRERSYLFLFC